MSAPISPSVPEINVTPREEAENPLALASLAISGKDPVPLQSPHPGHENVPHGPEANVGPPSERGAALHSSDIGDDRSDSTLSSLPDETVSEDGAPHSAGDADPASVVPIIRNAIPLTELGSYVLFISNDLLIPLFSNNSRSRAPQST